MSPNPVLLTRWLAELRAKWGRDDEVGTGHFHFSMGKVDYREHMKKWEHFPFQLKSKMILVKIAENLGLPLNVNSILVEWLAREMESLPVSIPTP